MARRPVAKAPRAVSLEESRDRETAKGAKDAKPRQGAVDGVDRWRPGGLWNIF
jgi:hypothetical protein